MWVTSHCTKKYLSTQVARVGQGFLPRLEQEGIVEVGGEMICPATGVVNCIIMQVLIAQVVDEMCARGAVPYALLGVYRFCWVLWRRLRMHQCAL